jgi:hypothetical protein
MPRPPRIHVDGALYHAEKTKNKNEKQKNPVKSFVVKSPRGNKRKRITKDLPLWQTPMATMGRRGKDESGKMNRQSRRA